MGPRGRVCFRAPGVSNSLEFGGGCLGRIVALVAGCRMVVVAPRGSVAVARYGCFAGSGVFGELAYGPAWPGVFPSPGG
jgi:hypothetical protein